MSESDVIVIGVDHNGLVAAAILAGRGLRVPLLEKNGYVRGMTGTRPLLFYSNPVLQLAHIVFRHGPSAMLGFASLVRFCKYPASGVDRFTPGRAPRSILERLASAANQFLPRYNCANEVLAAEFG